MAKSKVLCAHCDAKVTKAHAFCPNCKNPTVFATVEQRTAWELEQWTSKRTSPRKVVAAAVKPKRASAMVEQPAAPTPLAPPKPEPIKRVPTRRTIHPTVAAHAARKAAAASQPLSPARVSSSPVTQAEKSSPVTPAEKDRVIVLPQGPGAKRPAPAATEKPARTPKPARKKDAVAKETAPKKVAAATTRPRASTRKAPKMAPMPIEGPAANGNDHASNGNGHATNGNGTAAHGTNEQTEILRELLRRVVAIEEKMTVPAPRARRFRLRKG